MKPWIALSSMHMVGPPFSRNAEFIPEFEDEIDDDEEDENGRQRKKKYRYRWPDEVRDDVLARLLELNRQRALEEGQVVSDETAAALDAKPKKTKQERKPRKQSRMPQRACSR